MTEVNLQLQKLKAVIKGTRGINLSGMEDIKSCWSFALDFEEGFWLDIFAEIDESDEERPKIKCPSGFCLPLVRLHSATIGSSSKMKTHEFHFLALLKDNQLGIVGTKWSFCEYEEPHSFTESLGSMSLQSVCLSVDEQRVRKILLEGDPAWLGQAHASLQNAIMWTFERLQEQQNTLLKVISPK